MPQEPSVLGDVRLSLNTMKEKLKTMMPLREFYDFLYSQALPQLEQQVGSDNVQEVLRTICNVLHIQLEVSIMENSSSAYALNVVVL